MKFTLQKTKAAFGRFAIVFPPPTTAGLEELASCWMVGLGDFKESDVMGA